MNRREKLLKNKDDLVIKISTIDKYIRILDYSMVDEEDSLETKVFKLYMQLDNTTKVALSINDLGYRLKTDSHIGERKYTSNDITFIITNKLADVDIELREVVQAIQKENYGQANRRWS